MDRWQVRASLGFASGALAAVVQGLLIVLCSALGLFLVLGVPLEIEGSRFWFYQRIVWGGLWGLLFAVPLLDAWPQWRRGLVIAVLPAAATFFWFLPFQDQQGWLGLKLGPMMPVIVLFFALLWGAIAGWWVGHATAHEEGQ